MKKLLMALVLLPLMATAETEVVDGIKWTYTVRDGKAEVGDWSSPAIPAETTGAITIPSMLGGYPVTSIGDRAFDGCFGLTAVTIPSSVTSIGEYAFGYCDGLKSVVIPMGVQSIGDYAFFVCSALGEDVMIPESVQTIGRQAFARCDRLLRIVVDESNMCYCSVDGVLYDKEKTVLISCPGAKSSISIPSGVLKIEEGAFEGCGKLLSVMIPESVREIGADAFIRCNSLKRIEVDSANPYFKSAEGILFDKAMSELVSCPGGLDSVVIPYGVTKLAETAFMRCESLVEVSIPSTVRSIGGRAFNGCTKLKSVTIPASVMEIGGMAFNRIENNLMLKFEGAPPLGWPYCELERTPNLQIVFNIGYADKWMPLFQKSGFTNFKSYDSELNFQILPGEAVSVDTGLIGYTAKGLPSGLKYNKTTGMITGAAKKPTAAEGVTVKFTKKGAEDEEMTIVVEKEQMSVGCAGLEGKSFTVGVAGGAGIPLEIETQSGVKSVKVSKLPAGMKYNAKTGLIEGAPTKAGDYTVQIAVTAKSGAVETKDIAIRVDPLPDWAVGTFSGMIGRQLESSGGNGTAFYGSLQFTVKATGAVSAKVTAGGKTYSFSAKGFGGVEDGEAFLSRVNYLDADEVACRVSDTLVLDLATRNGDSLLLGVTLFQKSGHLCVAKAGGTFVRSGCATPYGLIAWRNEAGKDSRIDPGTPAAEAVARMKSLGTVYLKARELEPSAGGARRFALDWRGGEPLHRYGSKEADVTLSVDKSGNVKLSGKIDGVKLTASTPLRIGGNEWFTVTADSIAYDKKSGMDYEFMLGWDTVNPHTGVVSVTPDPNADPLTPGPDMHEFELWIEPFE